MSEQPDGDRPAEDAPRSEEAKYKAFVGGIPYAYEDRDLEQGELMIVTPAPLRGAVHRATAACVRGAGTASIG